jgi:hypothetical protein
MAQSTAIPLPQIFFSLVNGMMEINDAKSMEGNQSQSVKKNKVIVIALSIKSVYENN